MLGFIYSNQSLLIFIGILLILLMYYFVAKSLSAKVSKKKESAKTDKKDDELKVDPDKQDEVSESQTKSDEEPIEEQVSDDKSDKDDKKPKIVQIYKRKESSKAETSNSKQDNDPIYNRNIEFVNTSKNIAKFKSFVDETANPIPTEDDLKDEFGFVVDNQDDCEFCEDQVKHFDHTKRLSDIMKDDSDLFASHISDKYLKINSDRHLNLDKIESRLFARTEKMLKNSEDVVKKEESFDEPCCVEDDCCCEDDDVHVNMKTALIADTYFNRKRKK